MSLPVSFQPLFLSLPVSSYLYLSLSIISTYLNLSLSIISTYLYLSLSIISTYLYLSLTIISTCLYTLSPSNFPCILSLPIFSYLLLSSQPNFTYLFLLSQPNFTYLFVYLNFTSDTCQYSQISNLLTLLCSMHSISHTYAPFPVSSKLTTSLSIISTYLSPRILRIFFFGTFVRESVPNFSVKVSGRAFTSPSPSSALRLIGFTGCQILVTFRQREKHS